MVNAALRRTQFELGLRPVRIDLVAPYRYCFVRDGIMENEICPVLIGLVDQQPCINQSEVAAIRWVDWHRFMQDIDDQPAVYSDWCKEQARLLSHLPRFHELMGM